MDEGRGTSQQDQASEARGDRLERASREWQEIKRAIAPYSRRVQEGAQSTQGEWALTSAERGRRR